MPRTKKILFLFTLFILPTFFSLVFYYYVIRKPIVERDTSIYLKLPYFGAKTFDGRDTVYFAVQKYSGLSQDSVFLSSDDNFLNNRITVMSCVNKLEEDGSNKIATQFIRAQDKLKYIKDFRIVVLCNYNEKSLRALKNYNAKVHVNNNVWNYIALDSVNYLNYSRQNFLNLTDSVKPVENQIFLVDKNMHIRGIYDGLSIVEVNRMTDEVKVLNAEYTMKMEKQQFK